MKLSSILIAITMVMGIALVGGAYAQESDESMSMSDNMMSIPDTVQIAILLPLTGGLSSHGEQMNYAAELAVADFNEYLAEKGMTWQLSAVSEDTATNPVSALEKVQALHAKGVDIIVGPAGSDQLRGILGYMNDNNMIAISPSSTAANLAIANDAAYRLVADDYNQAKALGSLLKHEGIEAVVFIWLGDVYGDGLKQATAADFESRGGTVHDGFKYNPDTVEFSAGVGALADAVGEAVDKYGADKTAVLAISFDEIVSISQTASDYDVLKNVRWFGAEAIGNNPIITSDPIASTFADNTRLTAVQPLANKGDRAGSVDARTVADLGQATTPFLHQSYDSVWIAGLSVLKASSTDPADIKAVIHEVAASYSGALSTTKLNDAGDLSSIDYQIYEVKDGSWVEGDTYYTDVDTIASPITEDVSVGSLLPLTGGYSSVGVQVNAATVLAVSDFNKYLDKKGAGWELVLFQEDTASNPVIALEKAQALNSRGADILFGPAGSSRVKNVMSYANDNNMVVLSCCSTSTELAIADDRVFRIVADDANQGKAFGIILAHDGMEVVVPIWIADSYGDSLSSAAISEFEERGGMSDAGVRYNPDVREFSIEVDSLAAIVQGYVDDHGADKVAVVVVAFDEIVSIMQAADRYPVLKEVTWYGSETLAQNPFILRDRIARDFATDVEFRAIQVPLGDGPRAQSVTDALSVPFSGTPNAFAYNAYDAVWLAGLSMERAGSTDPADIAAILPRLAASYTGGALSSTQLNEAGDLALAIYGTWLLGDDWYVKDVIHIDDERVVPFQ